MDHGEEDCDKLWTALNPFTVLSKENILHEAVDK